MKPERIEERIVELIRTRGPLTGPDIAKELKLWSGTLYPALMRLERRRTLTSAWLDGPEPRPRLYRIAEERKAK